MAQHRIKIEVGINERTYRKLLAMAELREMELPLLCTELLDVAVVLDEQEKLSAQQFHKRPDPLA